MGYGFRSRCLGGIAFFFFLFCSLSEGAITLVKDISVELVGMENLSDFTISSIFIFFAYLCQYLGFAGFLEFTHPCGSFSPKMSEKEKARRRRMVSAEMKLGFNALLITVFGTVAWMYFLEPYTYFYGYFLTHEYNWMWFLGSMVSYAFWFDTYFFFTHKWLHDYDFLWTKVHYVHHQFKEPSAFSQFATHPIEAAIQGPIGHYCATLFFPFHPVSLALFGFCSSLWAMGAHDGRWIDFNSHYYHHCKGRGRYDYFNLAFLLPFWDILYDTRWYPTHPTWLKWKKNKGVTLFDTIDGKAESTSNDKYEAYVEGDKQLGIKN